MLTRGAIVFAISSAIALAFLYYVVTNYEPAVQRSYKGDVVPNGDLAYLLAAGTLIRSDEADTLYRLKRDRSGIWMREHGYVIPNYYPYPPATALLTSLLGPFEPDKSINEWRIGVAIASLILGVCVASTFKSLPWRIAVLIAILWWPPMLENADIGQTGALVGALAAVSTAVFLWKRELGVLCFGLLALKPTFLIGPALIVLQQPRALWWRFAAVAAFVILVPFLWLGFQPFLDYLEVMVWRVNLDAGSGHTYNQALGAIFRAPLPLWFALGVLLFIAAALLVRFVELNAGHFVGLAFAIFLAAIVNPHSLLYDWGIAFVGIMLLRQSRLFPEQWADLAFGLLVISLFFAGDWAWDYRGERGQLLRPLTGWALIVCGAILTLAIFRHARERGHLFAGRPAGTAPAEAAAP
jgi:hypothetical protein